MAQTRYNQLPKLNPEHAEELMTKCEDFAKRRYNDLKKLGKLN